MTSERLIEREAELADQLHNARIASIRAKVPTGPGSPFCVDCGNDMPTQRMQAGHTLCVPCKTTIELDEAKYRRVH